MFIWETCAFQTQELLSSDSDKQAIIFLKDIPFHHLQALVHYIYHGEVNIAEDQLADLLSTAESLQIKGLTDSDCKMNNIEQRNPDDLAESLRLNQIGQSINITETSCEASSPDSCEVAATLVAQGPSPSLTSATLSLPFMTTTSTTSLHSLQQPIYSSNPMASQVHWWVYNDYKLCFINFIRRQTITAWLSRWRPSWTPRTTEVRLVRMRNGVTLTWQDLRHLTRRNLIKHNPTKHKLIKHRHTKLRLLPSLQRP
jgi:hypothetical protein